MIRSCESINPGKMLRLTIFSLFLISTAYGSGEIQILHSPKSIEFTGNSQLSESAVSEVFSTALGFSIEHRTDWDGIIVRDPFNPAKALATIVVDGIDSLGLLKGHSYPLIANKEDEGIFDDLSRRIKNRFPQAESNVLDVELSSDLEKIKANPLLKDVEVKEVQKNDLKFLKLEVDQDAEFLKQIALLESVTKTLGKAKLGNSQAPDLLWFQIPGLHQLVDSYGSNTSEITEAKSLLVERIIELTDVLKKTYKDQVLVSVITSDSSRTRQKRQAEKAAKADDAKETEHNLAKNYGEEYPAIFNIILWFGVAMFFSLLAVCLAIANMDPGRDSIIYRMTNTRIKKDN